MLATSVSAPRGSALRVAARRPRGGECEPSLRLERAVGSQPPRPLPNRRRREYAGHPAPRRMCPAGLLRKKKERCDLPKKRKVEASEKVELLQPPPAGPIGNDQTENRLFLLAMFPSFLGFSRQKPKMSCVGTDELRTKGEAVARAGRLPGRHETDT